MRYVRSTVRVVSQLVALLLVGSAAGGCAAGAQTPVEEAEPAEPATHVPASPIEPVPGADEAAAEPTAAREAAAEPRPEPTGPRPLVDDDESDDFVVGPPDELADCEGRLTDAGIEYAESRIPVHETKGGLVCGAPQVVRYKQGPQTIRWSKSSPKLTCGMALTLARFETIVAEEAQEHFGKKVVRIEHMGTYNCREMAAYPGWVSEHSYGNAIDIKRFVLSGGREITVLGHYGDPEAGGHDDDSRFLQAVAARAFDEDVFSVVLTPAFDRAHRNHFHLDLARYRVDGTGRP